jgi:hypothetical protein
MQDFYKYLQKRDEIFPDREELMATYDLNSEEIDEFETALKDPFTFISLLYSYWPMISLSLLPTPEHKPLAVGLTAHISWEDRTTSFPSTVEVGEGVPIDGFLLAMWRKMGRDIAEFFVQYGMTDGLYLLSDKLSESDVDDVAAMSLDELSDEDDDYYDSELEDI